MQSKKNISDAPRQRRKKIFLSGICVLLATVIAVATFITVRASKPSSFPKVTVETVNLVNALNGGIVAQGDDCVYFCNAGIWKLTDGNAELAWSDPASSLTIHNGYLYYADANHSNAVFRRALPDGDAEQVTPFSSEYLAFSGDHLYFICVKRLEHRGIYRCAADGSDLTQISLANCGFAFPYEDWVYYTDKDARSKLMRIPAGGGEPQQISDQFVNFAFPNSADGRIYIATTEGVYRCKPNGRGIKLLMPIPTYRMTCSESSIFLSVYSYKDRASYPTGLFRMDSGADKMIQIGRDAAAALGVGHGQLYYKSMDNNLTLICCNFDGSNPTIPGSVSDESNEDN